MYDIARKCELQGHPRSYRHWCQSKAHVRLPAFLLVINSNYAKSGEIPTKFDLAGQGHPIKVIDHLGVNGKPICDFLLVNNCNYLLPF